MKRVLLTAWLAVVLLFSADLKARGNLVRIMPLGDSITEGGYNSEGQYYSNGGGYRLALWSLLTQAGFYFNFVGSLQNGPPELPDRHHEGHSGWRVDQLLLQAASWLDVAKPDIVLLHIGTNDIVQNYILPDAPNRFEQLVDLIRAKAPQADLFLSTIIGTNNDGFNLKIRTYNAAITAIILRKGLSDPKIHYVDMFNNSGLLLGVGGGLSDLTDGVHPTAAGYAKMAHSWFNALKNRVSSDFFSVTQYQPKQQPPERLL